MTWEERWHPLREEWVIVAAHREGRPWQGETIDAEGDPLPAHAADCYLCPGNERVSGAVNPAYEDVYVFDNDHPCVGEEAPTELEKPAGIYRNRRADGKSRVVCYTPRHDLTLAELPETQVVRLLEVLQEQYRELGRHPRIDHVLMFENKGEIVGVSNPHPHCQIYATNFVFKTIEEGAQGAATYLAREGRILFQDVIAAELADGRRVLCDRDDALAFVPYFARYPYEVYVSPRATHAGLDGLSRGELAALAAVLKDALVRYDNLWRMSLPYVMVFHQAPTDGLAHPGFHFHIEIHPPLRRPGMRKHLAGPEIGAGNFIKDSAPEANAAALQAVSTVHYKQAAPHG